MRRLLAATAVLLAPPATAGIVLAAQPAGPYGSYGLTAIAAGVRTAGSVGASGGLVTLDTASAYVTGRLDSSPTSAVLADPYEPGTLVRTLAGQVNGPAGSQVVVIPDAAASSPGRSHQELHTAPAQDAGPLHLRGGEATAGAGPAAATGTADGAGLTVDGALVAEGSHSSLALAATPTETRGTVTTHVATVDIGAGVLVLHDVDAHAAVSARGRLHTATATITVGGATVDGQAVALDDSGVHAVGTPLVTGQTLDGATAQANAVLAAAGITVHLDHTVHTTSPTGATADTGGIVVSLVTPDLPAGLAGNSVQVVIGGVVVTTHEDAGAGAVVDTGSGPGSAGPGTVPVQRPASGLPPLQAGAVPEGTPGAVARPLVAARAASRSVVVAGFRLSRSAALAGLACWQLLSLSLVTLYALASRQPDPPALVELDPIR